MPETQPKEQFSPLVVPRTIDDLIYLQLKDFKNEFRDTRRELLYRMNRLDDRIDYTRTALDEKIDRLIERIDRLADKINEPAKKF